MQQTVLYFSIWLLRFLLFPCSAFFFFSLFWGSSTSLPYATVKEKQTFPFLCREKPSSLLPCFFPVSFLYYSQKTLHFWAPDVCRLFPTPGNSLWHQLGCPTIPQFWHCVYLEIGSDTILAPPVSILSPVLLGILWRLHHMGMIHH